MGPVRRAKTHFLFTDLLKAAMYTVCVCCRFLTDRFALSVQEATIRWDIPKYVDYMGETYRVLKKLSSNKQLKKLFLESYGNTNSPKSW